MCRTAAQTAAIPASVRVLLQPEESRSGGLSGETLAALPRKVWLRPPTVCTEETLDMLAKLAAEQAEHVEGLVLGSVGQLGHDWPLPVAAGPGIPVMNRRAMAVLLEAGCQFVTASPELSGRETAALARGTPRRLIWAWGRVRLMLLHHCPARVYLGLQSGHASCRMCDEHAPDALAGQTLIDRRVRRSRCCASGSRRAAAWS